LAAAEMTSIFVDTRLPVKRCTPAAARFIQLIPTDIGRPLSDTGTGFPGVELAGYAMNALNRHPQPINRAMAE